MYDRNSVEFRLLLVKHLGERRCSISRENNLFDLGVSAFSALLRIAEVSSPRDFIDEYVIRKTEHLRLLASGGVVTEPPEPETPKKELPVQDRMNYLQEVAGENRFGSFGEIIEKITELNQRISENEGSYADS